VGDELGTKDDNVEGDLLGIKDANSKEGGLGRIVGSTVGEVLGVSVGRLDGARVGGEDTSRILGFNDEVLGEILGEPLESSDGNSDRCVLGLRTEEGGALGKVLCDVLGEVLGDALGV